MAEYDLTAQMIPFLDCHLAVPLMQFLTLKEIYSNEDLLKAKYELLSKTNMVDFTVSVYQELNNTEEESEELTKRREEVLAKLHALSEEVQKVLEVIEDPEVIASLKQDKLHNQQILRERFNLTEDMIRLMYDFGKLQYECANYGGAVDMLYHYRILSIDNETNMSALWGKMASEILTGNWDGALQDLYSLRDAVEQRPYDTPVQQLEHRAWLIHWSLFVFFNHPRGRDGIIDTFFQPNFLNTIQNVCPWIVRYLAAAVVNNRRRKNYMKDLVRVIQQTSYMYQDPVTKFITSLFVDYDFDAAQLMLKECEKLLENDFFLCGTLDEFLENARYYITETYCRIHSRIDIASLAQRLNLEKDEGEKWLVNLIRDTRMDAKIDFAENAFVMNTTFPTVQQQMIERTKNLVMRTQILSSKIEKREVYLAKQNAPLEN
ncbi:eIF3 subunit 6 N terminal domain-containing protein [Thamnocephalis sphaerospora]|uniref:Eukaryotic translation initiation factor 3 subunit E n=1 Tax=Thamnocephalis sphaerospora TaxID=78915 RepID=A0A4V1IWE0_9FUNG|nr:eIF3 subunit 6 N terminal domain-containing protein [Thamnocephalis sphaerospora]|eukprot:RKP07229.1 eIF3 subunit 6 N terminal domain-containing protein [Thamnocephalis sphaerospora]